MKKILITVGTRPEAIKMMPLVLRLKAHPEMSVKVCSTGQHKDILESVFSLFGIQADYDLAIMKKSQTLFDVTTKVLEGVGRVLEEDRPDIVLVHGDTTTSVASALAAFYHRIPVGHVEAGLRTNNIYSPWPEEMNRQMTGRIATYHFAPTVGSRRNLLDENVDPNRILVTGNTVIDALLWVADKIRQDVTVKEGIEMKLSQGGIDVDNYSLWENSARDLVLITGHRRENFGKPFEQICAGILELAKRCPSVDFLYPVHPNPRVKEVVDKYLLSSGQHNILLIEPVDYDCFVALMRVAKVILTDSGGVQEEAPSLGKPVLVMRDTTERPEAVNEGTVKLIGAVKDRIVDGVSELLECEEAYDKMAKAKNPYGDGTACNKIVEFLETIESR